MIVRQRNSREAELGRGSWFYRCTGRREKETRRSSTVDTKRQLPKRVMKGDLEERCFYALVRALI